MTGRLPRRHWNVVPLGYQDRPARCELIRAKRLPPGPGGVLRSVYVRRRADHWLTIEALLGDLRRAWAVPERDALEALELAGVWIGADLRDMWPAQGGAS